MNSKFEKIILLGSAKLLYSCAAIVREVYKEIPIIIIDNGSSEICDKYSENLNVVRISTKKEVMQYLREIKEK